MKITEIIEILRNDNTSYLWDLPKPQWKEIDYYNLNQIKEGKEYNKTKRYDKEKHIITPEPKAERKKLIRRKSDGFIFKGFAELCKETGINRTSISLALSGHPRAIKKYINEYELISNI